MSHYAANTGMSVPAATPSSLRYHQKPLYALLLLIFAASRMLYYALGVRFDARGLTWFFQFLDPELLRHRLLESLYYLHMQPPGYNLFIGVILKMVPYAYVTVFHAIHCVFGAVIVCLLFYLMRCLGVGVRLAFIAAALFMVSPGVVLFENFILYEYQMMFVLTISAVFLYRFIMYRSAAGAAGFLVCQFWLVMLRSQYHLVYFVAVFAVMLYLAEHRRKLVVCLGTPLLAVVLALYVKNLVLFGQFVGSTWMGMNMATITTHHLTAAERQSFVSEKKISPAPDIDAVVPLSAYRPYITMPAATSVPVLDDELKSTGAINFNHSGFLEVQKLYMRDGMYILRHYPRAFIRSVTIAWFTYFLPPGDFAFFDLNLPHIRGIERFFDVVFFGQFKHASDRKSLRQIHSPAIVLHTGLFLLIGLPALFFFTARFLYLGLRRHTLDAPRAALLGFMLFSIAYSTLIVNFLSSVENNRYRFPLDGFYVVLAAWAFEQVRNKFFCRDAVNKIMDALHVRTTHFDRRIMKSAGE
jgi:hypothetical protein